jgi:hypothetical protein
MNGLHVLIFVGGIVFHALCAFVATRYLDRGDTL